MTDSQALLVEYSQNGSESAFRELVARYIDLVYSTALRKVGRDTHLAQDVTQMVFLQLARKARRVPPNVQLGGWLHGATCNVAATLRRTERRRQIREEEALQMNALHSDSTDRLEQVAPILDDAISQLANEDRVAILLRFFERRDFRSIGSALGSTEDAARMRVNRALQKLELILKQGGATISAAALGAALTAEAVAAAPAGLAATVAGSALAGVAAAGGITSSAFKLMAMTKLKLATISTVAIGGLVTSLVVQHQSLARLRQDNRSLQQQVEELRDAKSQLAKAAVDPGELAKRQRDQSELLRLRGEVSVLRQQTKELDALRSENHQVRAALEASLKTQSAGTVETVATADYWPRDSWAFAGYASPDAALQTFVWAASRGDLKTLLGSVTGEAQKRIEKDMEGKSEGEASLKAIDDAINLKSVRVYHRNVQSDDTVIIQTGYENGRVTYAEKLFMKKIGNEWKVSDKLRL
jgi:RNA polymerase sigma factor (sigma-70 family)